MFYLDSIIKNINNNPYITGLAVLILKARGQRAYLSYRHIVPCSGFRPCVFGLSPCSITINFSTVSVIERYGEP